MASASFDFSKNLFKPQLDHGSEIDSQTSDFQVSPLHAAATRKNPEHISVLLDYGADTGLKLYSGETAIQLVQGDEVCLRAFNKLHYKQPAFWSVGDVVHFISLIETQLNKRRCYHSIFRKFNIDGNRNIM